LHLPGDSPQLISLRQIEQQTVAGLAVELIAAVAKEHPLLLEAIAC
jgi:hypothetical protein